MKITHKENKGKIRLGDLPNGSLFTYNGTLALKSEYSTNEGVIEAYIVGSGEFFWGGTATGKDQRNLLVRRVYTVTGP